MLPSYFFKERDILKGFLNFIPTKLKYHQNSTNLNSNQSKAERKIPAPIKPHMRVSRALFPSDFSYFSAFPSRKLSTSTAAGRIVLLLSFA